jgi:AraC family transcriptional regulator
VKSERMMRWSALATAGLTLVVAAGAAQAQAPEPFATIKEVKPFAYCCVPHKGPLTDMGAVITQLMQAMQSQNLFPSIRGPMVGVYYNAPGQVKPEDLSWEVGFPVADTAAVQPPLEKKVWKPTTVAVAVHKGPYSKTSETLERLMAWIGSQGRVVDGPVLERYLNNPMQVKPEELLTEIWIPIRKK